MNFFLDQKMKYQQDLEFPKNGVANYLLPKNISARDRELCLFVDINYTIIITDEAKGLDRETAIKKLLAEQKEYAICWDQKTNKKMTFKDYVKNYLAPNNEKEQIEHFKNFFHYLENSQQWDLLAEIKKEYNKLEKILAQEGDIFPSFIKLIQNLEKNKKHTPYTIILRTFGNDLNKTVAELEKRTALRFNSPRHFNEDGNLILGKNATTVSDILDIIKPFQHECWQDNFPRWKMNKFLSHGKLFPLDPTNKKVVSVFWDDNINEVNKKIIYIQTPQNNSIDQNKLQSDLRKLKIAVPTDTKKAIEDENYFIRLKNHALYWTNLSESKEVNQLISELDVNEMTNDDRQNYCKTIK